MNKIKDLFFSLSKSTRITLLSCGSFIVMTLLILLFFVIFPITPSEKAIAKFGREDLIYNNGDQESSETTTEYNEEGTETTTTTAVTFAVTNYEQETFTFTTASGFLSGGYIKTGQYGTGTVTQTTTEAATEPQIPELPIEEVTEPATEAPTESIQPITQEQTKPIEAPIEIPTDEPINEPVTDPPAPATEPVTAAPVTAEPDPPAQQQQEIDTP